MSSFIISLRVPNLKLMWKRQVGSEFQGKHREAQGPELHLLPTSRESERRVKAKLRSRQFLALDRIEINFRVNN